MGQNNLKEEALVEYLDECSEMIERLSQNLAKVEAGDPASDLIAAIYRDMHTIKGSSHLFGFANLGQIAHAMETCLDPVRKGHTVMPPVMIDALYSCIDVINALLAGIRLNKKEPDLPAEMSGILPRLISITEQILTGSLPPDAEKIPLQDEVVRKNLEGTSMAVDGFGFFDDVVPEKTAPEQPVSQAAKSAPATVAAPQSPPVKETKAAATEDPVKSETIRVHVSLLDSLMNLTGELVLIRNQLLQHARQNDDNAEFVKVSQRLDVLTAELQNEVMKTRLQPVGNVLNKFTRVVRDLGRELNKKIDLEIHGAETELDKTIIEAVQDPLTHIVRNSVDHGIEPAKERRDSGKSETGLIRIVARHESGQVIIEVVDDGRGLDRTKIGAKALEKGLVTKEALAAMTDREVHLLIMAPGFSTAAAVSNISGRGVGMDVVRTNIEKIGGMVDLTGAPGKGTTVRMKIPLTLAIVPALIVKSMNQRFAIPQAKLTELLRIDEADGAGEKVEYLQGRPVLRLRGKLLPLVHLSEVLGGIAQDDSTADGIINIVVLDADGLRFGLIVGQIEDSADIVVKSLSQFLKDLTLFSGATIMGDGTVALTLDVGGISAAVRLKEASDEIPAAAAEATRKKHAHELDTAEYLLVDAGGPGLCAIPLIVVNRLEEFDARRIEFSGEQRVIRYRDSLLPLISLTDFLHLSPGASGMEKEKVATVVVRRGDSLFGIEVESIHDVVSLTSKVDKKVRDRAGILGTVVARDRVYVVADVLGVIDETKARLGQEAGEKDDAAENRRDMTELRRRQRILLAEDSSFFRNYIKTVLEEAGFRAETAFDGSEAMRLLESHAGNYYSLVLSDIEMPNMDGLSLARKIRSSEKLAHLPLVAVTTRFNSKDIERGMSAGFDRYLEKLNAEKLISELDALFTRQGEVREVTHADAG